jgi:hypothetical protein
MAICSTGCKLFIDNVYDTFNIAKESQNSESRVPDDITGIVVLFHLVEKLKFGICKTLECGYFISL